MLESEQSSYSLIQSILNLKPFKMKKLSFFLWASIALIFLNFSNQSIAQPPPNLSLSEQMDYLMAPLDFTEVTSGLLLDKGFPMMEIAAYDGTTSGDTLKEYGDWFRPNSAPWLLPKRELPAPSG